MCDLSNGHRNIYPMFLQGNREVSLIMQIKQNTRKHLPAPLPIRTSRTKGLGAEVVGDILAGRSHTANYTFAA